MAIPKFQYTPVTPPRGRLVHAVELTASETACRKQWAGGWKISLRRVNCGECKRVIALRGRR